MSGDLNEDIYYQKYLKYKAKYLALKEQEGGLLTMKNGVYVFFTNSEDAKKICGTVYGKAPSNADINKSLSTMTIAYRGKNGEKTISLVKEGKISKGLEAAKVGAVTLGNKAAVASKAAATKAAAVTSAAASRAVAVTSAAASRAAAVTSAAASRAAAVTSVAASRAAAATKAAAVSTGQKISSGTSSALTSMKGKPGSPKAVHIDSLTVRVPPNQETSNATRPAGATEEGSNPTRAVENTENVTNTTAVEEQPAGQTGGQDPKKIDLGEPLNASNVESIKAIIAKLKEFNSTINTAVVIEIKSIGSNMCLNLITA